MTRRALKRQDKPQEVRRAEDFYPTGQPEAIRALLARDAARILPLGRVWEPAIGAGDLARPMIEAGLDVIGSDIVDRGFPGTEIRSFYDYDRAEAPAIITNPPYSEINARDGRGRWLRADGHGGIVHNGRRWQDGLTWEMFDGTGFTKVISKTRDSLPEPIRFPLDSLPRLRAMLLALTESRVGPVILSSTGMPYDKRTWASLWRRFARAGRVPDHVRCMDVRAGAISEADAKGASREQLSQAAQHTQITTTGRYVRNRSTAVAQVIDIRKGRN